MIHSSFTSVDPRCKFPPLLRGRPLIPFNPARLLIFLKLPLKISVMPVQVTIFLLLFGGLQGILFTLFLVRKKLHRSGYIFLLFYFAVLLMQITLKVMSKGWLMGNWPLLYQASYHLPFLYGPLAFLFARQMTGGKWKWIQLRLGVSH